jgi:hypothetical protein
MLIRYFLCQMLLESEGMEKIEDLERKIPIVRDKALINLVNGIQVNYDLIRYQKQQGFFGILFDQLA